eukprot:979006-Lingulodinium_polyedra.AAC.1
MDDVESDAAARGRGGAALGGLAGSHPAAASCKVGPARSWHSEASRGVAIRVPEGRGLQRDVHH